jgi:hypothetical protein
MIAAPAACPLLQSFYFFNRAPTVREGISATGHQYIMNDEPRALNVYAKMANCPPFGTESFF